MVPKIKNRKKKEGKASKPFFCQCFVHSRRCNFELTFKLETIKKKKEEKLTIF